MLFKCRGRVLGVCQSVILRVEGVRGTGLGWITGGWAEKRRVMGVGGQQRLDVGQA